MAEKISYNSCSTCNFGERRRRDVSWLPLDGGDGERLVACGGMDESQSIEMALLCLFFVIGSQVLI